MQVPNKIKFTLHKIFSFGKKKFLIPQHYFFIFVPIIAVFFLSDVNFDKLPSLLIKLPGKCNLDCFFV